MRDFFSDLEWPEWCLLSFMGLIISFGAFMIFMAIHQDKVHTQYLKDHGCQLFYEQPTGRNWLSGKIRHYERVRLYECVDGTRTEVE